MVRVKGLTLKKMAIFFYFNQVKFPLLYYSNRRGSRVGSDRPGKGFIRGRNSAIISNLKSQISY